MIYELAKKTENEVKKISDDYEIYISTEKSIELDSRKDQLNFAKENIEQGVGIRVIKNNKVGFAFTTNMNKIKETANQALENTKLNQADESYEFSHVNKVPNIKKVYDKQINDLSLDEYSEFLKNIINTTLESGCDVTSAGFSAGESTNLIINSNGVSIENKGSGYGVGLSVIIQENEKIATAYNSQSSRFFDIDGEKLANEVCDLSKNSLNTKAIKTDDYTVVLDYYAATGLLQTFMSAFDGENVRRQRSILQNKIGEEIANPTLSIIDNPLLEKGMNTCRCDGEGTSSQKTELVKDGVLNSFIYDIYTANKENTKSTSNGYRNYLTTPSISPSNLCLEFKEMKDISEIDEGVLTTSVLGAHTANPISGDFSVEVSNAFKIKNGELIYPINKAMISGNIFELMKSCEGLKSEIKQYGSYILPKLLVHNLKVVGQN